MKNAFLRFTDLSEFIFGMTTTALERIDRKKNTRPITRVASVQEFAVISRSYSRNCVLEAVFPAFTPMVGQKILQSAGFGMHCISAPKHPITRGIL